MKALYIVWAKVDESLPWIELKGIYGTRKAAKEAARELVGKATIKVVRVNAKAEGIRTLAAIGQKRAGLFALFDCFAKEGNPRSLRMRSENFGGVSSDVHDIIYMFPRVEAV